jgi:hypothetical protein
MCKSSLAVNEVVEFSPKKETSLLFYHGKSTYEEDTMVICGVGKSPQ